MITKKAHTEYEQVMPDDQAPYAGKIVGVNLRWWGMICLMLVGSLLAALQSVAAREKLLRYISYRNPDFKASVGVLSSGSIIDEEMYLAAEHAARDHHAQHGNVDIRLRMAYTGTTTTSLLFAFDELWNEGVRVFLMGGENEAVKALCHHVQYTGKQALIVSPTAFKPNIYCPDLVSLYPEHGALITAELTRIKANGLKHIIPVVTDMQMDQAEQIMTSGAQQGVFVETPVQLQSHNTSISQLQNKLLAHPRAAIWLSLGDKLPQLLAVVGDVLEGRLIMIHAHPINLLKLLQHPAARRMAEINAVCSTEWAGSSQVSTVARRHLLASLQPVDPLTATLAYDAASLALSAFTHHLSDDVNLLKSTMLKEASHIGVTNPGDVLGDKVSGLVVWKRLVMQHLIGKTVLQDSPWLMEGMTRVTCKGEHPWLVVQQTHAPVQLVTEDEVMALAELGSCKGDMWVKVTAHDPLSHRPITNAWIPSATPQILLLPNGSPNGFTFQTGCTNIDETHILELACQGAVTHNDSLVCITASGDSRNRRTVRSLVTRYGYPNKRRRYPIRKQQQGRPTISTVQRIKKFLNHEDFKAMIPQIGGCVGATAGCSFCFIYTLLSNANINPGVCYGACSVAVGGSCTTLLAKGIQYHSDHTVVCTELFTQGRISLSSYMADASYGSRLATTNPRALRGYQTLAAPIVAVMQVSPIVSSVVDSVAQPWLRHMEHEEGLRPNDDALGSFMTRLGLPVCYFVAIVIDNIDTIALVTLLSFLRRVRR